MNEKLTVQDLVRCSAERLGLSKAETDTFIKEFFQLIADALVQEKYVKIKGLGTFKLIDVDSRQSVNVNTGERFEIQGHTKISFTPDPTLRDVINRPFAHFETVLLQNEELLKTTPEEIETDGDESDSVMDALEVAMTEETTAMAKETSVLQNVETPQAKGRDDGDTADEKIEQPRIEEQLEEPLLDEELQSEETLQKEEESQPTEAFQLSEEPEEATLEESLEDEKQNSVKEEVKLGVKPEEKEVPLILDTSAEEAEHKRSMNYFIGIVILVSLLCIAVLAFIYFPGLTRALYGLKEAGFQKVDSTELVKTSALPVDTSIVHQVDTFAAPSMEKQSVPEVKEQVVEQAALQPEKSVNREEYDVSDGTLYEIVGTQESYTIHEGETLTRVSLRFWGTKSLWPYLVKHNPTVITNPDHVPYGTTIQIPKLKKK